MGKLHNEEYPLLNNYFSLSLEHNKCFSKDLVMSLFIGVIILTHFQVMKKYLKMWIKRLPCFSMCIFFTTNFGDIINAHEMGGGEYSIHGLGYWV
jgi:hypothetical protein